jgi:hypothetical protein
MHQAARSSRFLFILDMVGVRHAALLSACSFGWWLMAGADLF